MAMYQRWPSLLDERLPQPEDLFRALFNTHPQARGANVFPAINLYDDGNAFLLRAEVPGIDKETLEITAKGTEVTLRGERNITSPGTEASFHRREREAGKFRRTVTLPQPVDADGIKASYKAGVLEVVVPRAAEAKPRKIAIS